ncbi:hypothetical protein BN1013_01840 [Candidatus Rubidus massiliensis]|nr:MAG: hypothetical protein BGO10_00675 [Chlamydia sp. 32-24]CDZ81304.1 hypothetical protein BN1013_01840 [Candidatus Rubidus massiliensis]
MKNLFNAKSILSATLVALSLATFNMAEAQSFEDKICAKLESCPYLGLVLDKVKCGPITIEDVRLNRHEKVAIVSPGETVKGKLRYEIDSDKLDWNVHHIIVGLKDVGAQDCITHSFGFKDSKGKSTFELKAPKEKGVYEVRFSYAQAFTCEGARDTWDADTDQPSSKATMGILIVE